MIKDKINEYTFRITQANVSALVVIGQDMLVDFIREAIDSYNQEDVDDFEDKLERARKVQSELINMLDVIDDVSRDVMTIYVYINKMLIESRIKKDISELDRMIDIVNILKKAFEELSKQDDSNSLMENTHQVYSGLTYGKGHLNDSLDPMLSTNRGYKA